MLKQLPNMLTILRLLLSPFAFVLISRDRFFEAFFFCVFLFLTDFFDGFFSRKFNAYSRLGEILDPFADRVTVLFIALGLYYASRIPLLAVFILFLREVFAVFGFIFIRTFKNKNFKIRIEGKFVAAVIYVMLGASIILKFPDWFYYLLAGVYFAPFYFYIKSAFSKEGEQS